MADEIVRNKGYEKMCVVSMKDVSHIRSTDERTKRSEIID